MNGSVWKPWGIGIKIYCCIMKTSSSPKLILLLLLSLFHLPSELITLPLVNHVSRYLLYSSFRGESHYSC